MNLEGFGSQAPRSLSIAGMCSSLPCIVRLSGVLSREGRRYGFMINSDESGTGDGVIGTIQNSRNPDQTIAIKYLKEENAFVTSGIEAQLGVKDILIPAHLVAVDFQLVGAIISTILEKISQAYEKDSTFDYVSKFEVLDRAYSLTEHGEYMKLDVV